ncbi:MAG: acetyl-CoA carboxylase biotin carboxyl carrier protein [Nitrospirota bacterium]|nr:MAG: acetyl-CoA carboxylase biotin carboxyl carrier protein [Nitrospirota bacterium]
MNFDNIKKILKLIRNTDISELEYEKDGEKIRVKRENSIESEGQKAFTADKISESRKEFQAGDIPETDDHRLFTLTSPIVGSFYRSPAPDDPPFVEIGTQVRKGQVLCIIEAMKLMNEIESEVDGVVARILVDNGQPVEYGEPLFLIDQK